MNSSHRSTLTSLSRNFEAFLRVQTDQLMISIEARRTPRTTRGIRQPSFWMIEKPLTEVKMQVTFLLL